MADLKCAGHGAGASLAMDPLSDRVDPECLHNSRPTM